MACSSSAKVAPRSVTIEADAQQWKDLIEIYAKGATLAAGIKQTNSVRDAMPEMYYLTTAGCNNNHTVKIGAMMNAVYSVVRTVANDQELPEDKIQLDSRFTSNKIYRLDAAYTSGNEFGFLFTTMCDSMNVIVVKKIYPKAGILISKDCVEKDQWGVYTDGEGGSYRQQIKVNSPDCGYVPPIAAGTLKEKTCRGVDQWATYHDGNYGTYEQLFQEKSTACGYVKPPVGGTLIKKDCVGTTQWAYFADGEGGTRRELWQEKAKECGYVEPPKAGTLIKTECVGTTLWGVYADGEGGTKREIRETNSRTCGYIAPTPQPSGSPTPTPAPSGSPTPTPSPSGSPPPGGGPISKSIPLYIDPGPPIQGTPLQNITLEFDTGTGALSVGNDPLPSYLLGSMIPVKAYNNLGVAIGSYYVNALQIGYVSQGIYNSIAYMTRNFGDTGGGGSPGDTGA